MSTPVQHTHSCTANKYVQKSTNNHTHTHTHTHTHLFGLNHMFTVLAGRSLGQVAHPPTRTIQGSLVHGRLTQRACEDSKAQPEVERSWKSAGLRMSRGHEYTVFSNIYRDSDCGCLSEESKPHLLHPLPAKWLKPSLSGCFKLA